MDRSIAGFQADHRSKALRRSLVTVCNEGGGRISIGGRSYRNLSSNDYLGFASHPDIRAALYKGGRTVAAASASPLVTGHTELHRQLEEAMARFKSKPAALVFPSGWQANVGVVDAMTSAEDVVFCDRLAHASILDGCRLSRARFFRFRHNDVEHLGNLLDKHRDNYRNALVITESVFSMDGDIAPLSGIAALKRRHDFVFMVDEAHATGLFGASGSGVVEEEGVTDEVDLVMGTFSKGLGGFGAYIASSKLIHDHLLNNCRSYIYSTALPPPMVACNIEAIKLLRRERSRADMLLRRAACLRKGLNDAGFQVKGCTQIIPVLLNGAEEAIGLSERLGSQGWWVAPMRPPTVPPGTSRLRISLSYYHNIEDLQRFLHDIIRSG